MENNSNGIKIAALTLGIISIIFFAFIYISIPAGVLAIVYGSKFTKEKSAVVTGIIGITICVAVNATMIPLFMTGVLHI